MHDTEHGDIYIYPFWSHSHLVRACRANYRHPTGLLLILTDWSYLSGSSSKPPFSPSPYLLTHFCHPLHLRHVLITIRHWLLTSWLLPLVTSSPPSVTGFALLCALLIPDYSLIPPSLPSSSHFLSVFLFSSPIPTPSCPHLGLLVTIVVSSPCDFFSSFCYQLCTTLRAAHPRLLSRFTRSYSSALYTSSRLTGGGQKVKHQTSVHGTHLLT